MLLALMPQSPPLHIHTPMSSTTMSLAILPSAPASLAYSQPSPAMPLPPSPSPSKRPRLSLNTTNVQPSVYGKKGSTSLRLETLSATSPTARNTFRNAHNDNAQRRADSLPQKPTLAPLSTALSHPAPPDDTDVSDESASSTTTATSCSTATSATVPPYKLSYNVPSILSNGPIPKSLKRRISLNQVRPMFPTQKKVTFRSPLTEDIKNTKYTLKHSDIESSTSTISTLELSPPEDNTSTSSESDDTDGSTFPEITKLSGTSSPKIGDKRDSSDEEESDAESCPATPVAGRRKRHRHWVWTLGPVVQAKQMSDEADKGTAEKQV